MIIQSQLEINKQPDKVIDLIKSENNLEKFKHIFSGIIFYYKVMIDSR
jgi:CRISPR/Cas system CSM-associated protein Csm2 small subunit